MKIENQKYDLFEIKEFVITNKKKLKYEQIEKIKRTYEALKPNQCFCVPRILCGHVTLRSLFVKEIEAGEVLFRPVGAPFAKEYLETRVIKTK